MEGGRRGTDDMTDYADGKRVTVYVSSHDVDIRNNILVNNGGQQLRWPATAATPTRSETAPTTTCSTAPTTARWSGGASAARCSRRSNNGRRNPATTCIRSLGAPTCQFSPGLDFRLQPDSVGVGQGQTLPEVPADILGARPGRRARPAWAPTRSRPWDALC